VVGSHAFPTELRKFVEVAVKGGNQGTHPPPP
jgi:hypothetical protein